MYQQAIWSLKVAISSNTGSRLDLNGVHPFITRSSRSMISSWTLWPTSNGEETQLNGSSSCRSCSARATTFSSSTACSTSTHRVRGHGSSTSPPMAFTTGLTSSASSLATFKAPMCARITHGTSRTVGRTLVRLSGTTSGISPNSATSFRMSSTQMSSRRSCNQSAFPYLPFMSYYF